jgi:hypothetical protein
MSAPISAPISAAALESERRELETLLGSAAFSRAPNLHRFLEFIGSRYFEGRADEIKEYTVAVHALNRPEDFDPRADTIVRVTAVALRKRLEQYYASEGASHPVHVELPPGQYIPRFVHRAESPAESEPSPPADPKGGEAPPPSRRHAALAALTVVVALAAAAVAFRTWHARPASVYAVPPPATVYDRGGVRFLPGEGRGVYNDATGEPWLADTFCTGGRSFQHPVAEVQGSDEPVLFARGREGRFACRVPVPPGTYELHLYFAEAAGGKEATKQVAFQINDGAANALDVVNDAPGAETATAKAFTDIKPMSDGTIHLDFVSEDSFVNAIEVLPAAPGQPLPLRILAGRATYHDRAGNTWLPDRFFFGGRRTYRAEGTLDTPDQGLFQWERFGHFRYNLPVVEGHEYKVTLYFSEAWFGVHGGGSGGVGSRVFDVYCNGTTLLKDFDILHEQENGVAIRTFRHVRPTAQGKLELSFVPVRNYPLINAIEVIPES